MQQIKTDNVKFSLKDYAKFIVDEQDEIDTFDVIKLSANIKNNVTSESFISNNIIKMYKNEQKEM
jgi:hypothetical protein